MKKRDKAGTEQRLGAADRGSKRLFKRVLEKLDKPQPLCISFPVLCGGEQQPAGLRNGPSRGACVVHVWCLAREWLWAAARLQGIRLSRLKYRTPLASAWFSCCPRPRVWCWLLVLNVPWDDPSLQHLGDCSRDPTSHYWETGPAHAFPFFLSSHYSH